ncbi:MAG: ribonuclease HII [Candidatus Moraniibacteriota bacterium]|nr:MAG: ribonuclease HII [Candidatus Moranbacteria bacterium]
MKNSYAEKTHLPTFEYEQLAAASHRDAVGVDEAGRGPLAGPVVAAAARYRSSRLGFPCGESREWRLVRDSKTLSGHQREEAYRWILANFEVGVGVVDAETIDRVNILQATFLAMRMALADLLEKRIAGKQNGMQNVRILVDGNRVIPKIEFSQEAIVHGDARSVSIAAASIVAKVTRDRRMRDLDILYPEYGFSKHKGYGTAAHLSALQRFGPCPIHRQSFAPVVRASREFARN